MLDATTKFYFDNYKQSYICGLCEAKYSIKYSELIKEIKFCPNCGLFISERVIHKTSFREW